MRFAPLVFALAALWVFLVVGCGQHEVQTPASAPKTPKRIVSLTPSNTEILFALGLGDKVVGVTSRCDYPPEARNKPKVGDMNISTEKVVALKPDLVLANTELNASVITKLKNLNIRVLAIDPKTFGQVISNIRLVGRDTGASAKANDLATSIESAVKAAKGSAKGHPKVLVAAQSSPLWTAGPDTLVDDMIGYVGGENVGRGTTPGKFNQMSTETAVAANPHVIIVTLPSDKTFFEQSSIWKGTNAVRNHRVVLINPDLIFRAGPRLVQGLEAMKKAVQQ